MNRGNANHPFRGALWAVLAALGLFWHVSPAFAARAVRADTALEQQLLGHIRVLASDEFQGRAPGTEGEAKTLRYLAKEWFGIGLISGTNDPSHEWFAPVTIIAREPSEQAAQFFRSGRPVAVPRGEILVLTAGKRSLLRSAPLLFVGNAEGQDYTRNELAGRVAVVLDTTRRRKAPAMDDGAAVTARQNQLLTQGAAAVLTVLDGERSLGDVTARRKRTGYALSGAAVAGDIEAFITQEAMDRLLRGAGQSLATLSSAAQQPGFVPVPLDLTVTFEATTRETTIRTHNLIAKLPGRRPGSGALLLLAHWDHFGICRAATTPDPICNGAIDNASGVAALTEVARQLAKGPPLDRDVYFLATTAEEFGLVGAHAFAEDPPLPLDQIVAAFNIDSVAIAPRGAPFAIVGRGMTSLDAQIEHVVRAEKGKVVPGDAANEYVKRQDGWALLQHDVPAVMVTTAYSNLDLMRAFFASRYHQPSDNLSQGIELGGAADDVRMLTALTRWFGSADPAAQRGMQSETLPERGRRGRRRP